ncbi:MAG TPA: hypothetical protein VJ825_09000 [Gemmatimonadaceae bacterium]|nr:hypothetical protein [Gemmatimonadaceae bacterium]
MIYYPEERRWHSHRSPSELIEDDVRAIMPPDFRVIEAGGTDQAAVPRATLPPSFLKSTDSDERE